MNKISDITNTLLVEPDTWEPIPGYELLKKYVDDFPSSTIVDKVISTVKGLSLSGEKNSEYVTFQMNRYHDGIDLSDKLINICYNIVGEDVGDSNPPVNVYKNNTMIRFGWILPETITMRVCTVSFIVLIVGKEYEKDYIIQTRPTTYSVQKGFECGEGIIKPEDSWFEQFLIRVDLLVKQKIDEYSGFYEDLKEKPMLNGVEINGEKTFQDYGLIPITNEEIDNLIY